MNYDTVIGLEVHLHLKTRTKAFCACSTEFGNEPNSQVCPVCLGFPGSLPVLNKNMLDYAIKVAIALNCKVQEFTKFDRKNYFYPDLPKNYQISQYDLPLSKDGFIDIAVDGKSKRIGITRVHMEEDAGKLIHEEENSLVDFNRSGMPLLEIVSEPDMSSPEEAHAYLACLKGILEYLDVSDCDMEKGSLRCDANISLKIEGETKFGTKTELKNMNSFKAVKDALAFEVTRQAKALDEGKAMVQETRLWDERSNETISMRTKEEAKDYRYFPEPDLTPFIITDNQVAEIKKTIPELPHQKLSRFMNSYGLSEYDAGILIASKRGADFAEECIKLYSGANKKTVVNWFIGPLLAEAKSRGVAIHELNISPRDLIGLLGYVERQEISNLSAKIVLTEMITSGRSAEPIIRDKGLIQISDTGALIEIMELVIKENEKSVSDYNRGKDNALMFLVGQIMKRSQGKANPKIVQDMLKRRLSNG